MATVAVQPEVIRWAIDRSGLQAEDLVEKFPKIGQWQSGEKRPTLKQLERFAKATMAPLGALFLNEPPHEVLPVPDFRTRNNKPLKSFSPNLIETIRAVQQRQQWTRDWLIEDGADPIEFVGGLHVSHDVKSAAMTIRQRIGLDPDWAKAQPSWNDALQTLRSTIERSGVLVFSNSVVGLNNTRPLDPNEFRGFVLCDNHAPAVFLNDADTISARVFTLVHELVHVWLGQGGIFNLENLFPADEQIEIFCNRVAAEFLIPEDELKQRWDDSKRVATALQAAAKWFKVSPVVVARRTLDLGFITKYDFFQFYEAEQVKWQELKAGRKEKKGGGNFYATQGVRLGKRFSAAVVRAAREGRILYQDAFRLTGMSGKTFHTFADLVTDRVKAEHE